MAPTVIIGALAQRLIDARDDKCAAEMAVDDLLHELFPSWRRRFPRHLSWIWVPPSGLDVFGAIDSPNAVHALALAGFTGGIRIHEHEAGRSLTCTCPTQGPT